jgi:preprotein translocase subunit SecG
MLALVAMATPLESEASAADSQSESRSQRAARMNSNLLTGTIVVLALFVVLRLMLVWQISRKRKKLAQNNILEGEA